MQVHIRKATLKDYPQILGLLTKVGLPIEGVANQLKHFFVADVHGDLIGVCGMHVANYKALLRSMAVVSGFRNKGIGQRMFDALLSYANELGYEEIYVVTPDKKEYFKKLGFKEIERDGMPAEVQALHEHVGLTHVANYLRLDSPYQ